MSSPPNQSPQPKSASSSPIQPDKQASLSSASSAKTSPTPHSDSPSPMISSASSTPVEVMPSTDPAPEDSTRSTEPSTDRQALALRQQPIPPASEPMQYRAIGLIQGKYAASAEQFTRGTLTTTDGTEIGAVLLGRVMSLVKKHLDLEQSHLWVVYPRTRDKNDDLHMQVVGVWEPEKLAQGKLSEDIETIEDTETAEDIETSAAAISEQPSSVDSSHSESLDHQDGYFSIRGEVLYYSPEEERLIIKIQQSPRSGSDEGKAFKLNLKGALPGNKAVGYFWDLQVQRENNLLVVQEGNVIGLVPPRKRKDKPSQDRRRGGAQGGYRKGQRPTRMGDRPISHSSGSSENRSSAPTRREPIAKPVKRPKNESS